MLSESADRQLRMSELADLVVQSRSRLTHTAARLEKRGWVQRKPVSATAAASSCCSPTPGRSAIETMAEEHVNSVRRISSTS